MSDRIEQYQQSIDRAMQWMLPHQEERGSFGDVNSMAHYMALGASLLYNGAPREATRLLSFMRQTYITPDGDFDMPEIREGIVGRVQECRYMPSWVIFSAHVNLAYDISMQGIPHVLKFQDQETGGLFGSEEDLAAGKGVINTASTCLGGIAAVVTGKVAEAKRMGDHVVDNLIGRNPDLGKAFYPIWEKQSGLRTDDEAPSSPNVPKVLLRSEPVQGHFLTGMIMAFLCDLHQVTRDRKYLDGALEMYEFGVGESSVIYENTLSHKFAWGSAALYRQTGEARHLESACRICDYLVSTQESDGSYLMDGAPADWPYQSRLNLASQFALWIRFTLNLL
jgi:hypothetical protein